MTLQFKAARNSDDSRSEGIQTAEVNESDWILGTVDLDETPGLHLTQPWKFFTLFDCITTDTSARDLLYRILVLEKQCQEQEGDGQTSFLTKPPRVMRMRRPKLLSRSSALSSRVFYRRMNSSASRIRWQQTQEGKKAKSPKMPKVSELLLLFLALLIGAF